MSDMVPAPPREMTVVYQVEELAKAEQRLRRDGGRLGLVPTMGALHDGHMSLVRASLARCEATAVSIFVNPAQFAPHEDFRRYPRMLEADCKLLAAAGADLVFAPAADDLYPGDFSTWVEPPAAARLWEGECRPGHFRGVATIVLKLLNLFQPDVAFFGQKDFQQARVIRRMVADLNLPVEIDIQPTVRDADGLALSSRNAYLSPAERENGLALWRTLRRAAEAVDGGARDGRELAAMMVQTMIDGGVTRIDYAAVADPETLEPLETVRRPLVLLVAAWVGSTRLIDNLVME
jgi:pantoate--beta-alanine ligase